MEDRDFIDGFSYVPLFELSFPPHEDNFLLIKGTQEQCSKIEELRENGLIKSLDDIFSKVGKFIVIETPRMVSSSVFYAIEDFMKTYQKDFNSRYNSNCSSGAYDSPQKLKKGLYFCDGNRNVYTYQIKSQDMKKSFKKIRRTELEELNKMLEECCLLDE